MNWKNLTAALTSAFALTTGSGAALAAEPAQANKPAVTASEIADYNNHTGPVVQQRNLHRDIQDETIFIKEAQGRYLVHEPAFATMGKLQSYSKEELIKKHGPIENLRTYEQYKTDAELLLKTPGKGPNLSINSEDMNNRLQHIRTEMKASGETFQTPVKKHSSPAP